MISKNIKFITWNYDLQLELAFKQFLENQDTLATVNNNFPFIINSPTDEIQVCHLNGFGSYFKTELNGDFFMTDEVPHRTILSDTITNLKNLLKKVEEIKPNFNQEINFAWENNIKALNARSVAKKIAKQTHTLIIIGYSFPIFNREIDAEIFKEMTQSGNLRRIYYQSPDANEKFLRDTFSIKENLVIDQDLDENSIPGVDIIIVKEKMDQFVIPQL